MAKYKFHYIYLTTNNINGKKYIGEHSTNNINDSYLGSGKLILSAIKKYGKENFKKEILEQFENKQKAFDAQEKYIIDYSSLVPDGYNISPSGGHGTNGGYMSLETINKIKSSLSKSIKGRIFSKEHKLNLSKARLGKKLSEETKSRLSKSHLGKTTWIKGKEHSDETKRKISIKGKGYKHTEKTKEKFKNRIPWNKGLKIKI